MNTPLVNALLVTAIGMSIVFASILVLWGLMSLVVRLTSEQKAGSSTGAPVDADRTDAPQSPPSPSRERKRRAAAAAVAVALASLHQQATPIRPVSIKPGLSAWQSVMRANQIKSKQQRGRGR